MPEYKLRQVGTENGRRGTGIQEAALINMIYNTEYCVFPTYFVCIIKTRDKTKNNILSQNKLKCHVYMPSVTFISFNLFVNRSSDTYVSISEVISC